MSCNDEIDELHHGKQHAAYVKGANDTLEQIAEAREGDPFGSIVGLETTPAFHLTGHAPHQVWWRNLSPNGGDKPTGEPAAAVDEHFGSFDELRARLGAAANTIQGSTGHPGLGTRGAAADHAATRGLPTRTCRSRPRCCWTDVSARFEAAHAGQNGLRLPRG